MGGFDNQLSLPENFPQTPKSQCRVVREAEGTTLGQYEGHMLKLRIGSSLKDIRIARQVLMANYYKNLQQKEQNEGHQVNHENSGSVVHSSLLSMREIQEELEIKLLPRVYSLICKVRHGLKMQSQFIVSVRKGIMINENNLNLHYISTNIIPKLRFLENNLKYEIKIQTECVKELKKYTDAENMFTNNSYAATASAVTNSSNMLAAVSNQSTSSCAPT